MLFILGLIVVMCIPQAVVNMGFSPAVGVVALAGFLLIPIIAAIIRVSREK